MKVLDEIEVTDYDDSDTEDSKYQMVLYGVIYNAFFVLGVFWN